MSAAHTIGLVARREITTRLHAKAFLVSNTILLLVIIGGLIITSIVMGRHSDTKIGVVGGNDALTQSITRVDPSYKVQNETNLGAARAAVERKDIEAALINDAGKYTVVFKSSPDPALLRNLSSAVHQTAINKALSPEERAKLDNATAGSALNVERLTPVKNDEVQRLAIAYVVVILLSITISTGGQMMAQGVVEEKTSRVVEILLATIQPLHLLAGKVLGIGLLTFGQVCVQAVAGLVTAQLTGLLTVGTTALSAVAVSLLWYVLGYLFFAILYAATASMVSRQEEVAAATAPLTILFMAMMYCAIFGIRSTSATWLQVLSYIPPFSAALQPMLVATGYTTFLHGLIAVVIMVVSCAIVMVVACRIYRRSILHTGTKMTWKKALFSRT